MLNTPSIGEVQLGVLRLLLADPAQKKNIEKALRNVNKAVPQIERQIETFSQAIVAAASKDEWLHTSTLFERLAGLDKKEASNASKAADPNHEVWIAFNHALLNLQREGKLSYRGHWGWRAN
jgi:hypothetical protein